MRRVVATALAMLLLLFLLPLLVLQGEPLAVSPLPRPTARLPIDRTTVTPRPDADSQRTVTVKLGDGTVVPMTMDKYLWRVVAAEMPASFAPEALKAQTVAARTYTVAKMGREVALHPDADICTHITCCQAYLDPAQAAINWGDEAEKYTEKIEKAVADTDGMLAQYQGAPIQAVFFSSAAGRTVDAVEVWGSAVPYLTGVSSPEGAEVPNYHSTTTMVAEGFRNSFLAQYPQADLAGDASGWFQNTVLNSAGGVSTVDVGGVTVKGSDLRTLLGLRSAHFTVAVQGDAITFSVTGYGHGVGMSQYGANALAGEGKSYVEILKWYYKGIEVERES